MSEDLTRTPQPLEPLGSRLVGAGRWLVGGLTLVLGFTWMLLTATGPSAAKDIAIGLVLVGGALVVLMPHRVPLPRRATLLVAGGFALAGTIGGLAVKSSQVCCDVGYDVYRGWPFVWITRGAIADDEATARRLAAAANFDVDLLHAAVDLLLFGYLGLIVMAVLVLVRRPRD